jgi:hypothetical protein
VCRVPKPGADDEPEAETAPAHGASRTEEPARVEG